MPTPKIHQKQVEHTGTRQRSEQVQGSRTVVNAQRRNVGPQMSSWLRISAPSATKAQGFCNVVFWPSQPRRICLRFDGKKRTDVLIFGIQLKSWCGEAITLARTSSVTVGTVKQEKGRSVRLALSRIYVQPISSAPCATRVSFATCFKKKESFWVQQLQELCFSEFANFNTCEAMVHLLYIF